MYRFSSLNLFSIFVCFAERQTPETAEPFLFDGDAFSFDAPASVPSPINPFDPLKHAVVQLRYECGIGESAMDSVVSVITEAVKTLQESPSKRSFDDAFRALSDVSSKYARSKFVREAFCPPVRRGVSAFVLWIHCIY